MKTKIIFFLCLILLMLVPISVSALGNDNGNIDISQLDSYADINLDGTVNENDTFLLRKVLIGIESDVNVKERCKITTDNAVDILDLVRFKAMLDAKAN